LRFSKRARESGELCRAQTGQVRRRYKCRDVPAI